MPKEEWRESLRPRIEAARAELAQHDPVELARRGGLTRNEDGFELSLFGQTILIRWPTLVSTTSDDKPCPEELQILLLDYLARGDATEPSGQWIGFQELPDGSFYRHAFQGYSADQLVRDLAGDIAAFRRAAEKLGGDPLEMGDAGYSFHALPHILLAVVWWAGDEEFPANATVLFDATAGRYLPTDGLAILGRMLCRTLAKLGKAES